MSAVRKIAEWHRQNTKPRPDYKPSDVVFSEKSVAEIVQQFKYDDLTSAQKQILREKLVESQNGQCSICKRFFSEDVPPHLDHCHETLVSRELLCRSCNFGLGNFE